MSPKMKKFLSYYRPYLKIFTIDMVCALTASGTNLAFPLLVRYIALNLLQPSPQALAPFLFVAGIMVAMILVEYYCNFFITYYGHLMGAKMESDLRQELLSISRSSPLVFTTTRRPGSSCRVSSTTSLRSPNCITTARKIC